MFGKKVLSLCLSLVLLLQISTVVLTEEVSGEVLTIRAKPVSTKDFAQEWKDYRLTYAMLYALSFAVVLLK
ncbi:MAG: hypothetical protein JW782_06110 [Candidatus Saganbacteria bacterium]|nr:hypothetical protein [Candidatus Saganbacteria bacterium]